MSSPLEEHGGIVPSEFHTKVLSDKINKVFLFTDVTSSSKLNFGVYRSILLNYVHHIFFNFANSENVQQMNIHPLISFSNTDDYEKFAINTVISNEMEGVFFYKFQDNLLVHPEFWSILKNAKENTNYTFYDSAGKEHTLIYATKDSIASNTVNTCKIAAYTDTTPAIINAVERGIFRNTKNYLQEMIIDTTNVYTPLCYLAMKYMTDKSPFNIFTHRHPYTAVYDTFLTPYKFNNKLKFGEIGVLNGASIRMWRDYFPNAYIHGFDIVDTSIEKIQDIPGVTGHLIDASIGLAAVLQKECIGGNKFDILLEDASHRLDHQLLFIADAIEYVNPGGLLIIEDIFREIPASRFEEALSLVSHKVSKALLVQPEHIFRYSTGWENDRILFIWVA
uniref:Methyltransferase domain-containing protein n=1 Tax=viral metagenome TaxID=1070528 RepID=A0A6C0AMH8_9ZZZZ